MFNKWYERTYMWVLIRTNEFFYIWWISQGGHIAPPLSCWLFNLEWVGYFEHVVQSLTNFLVSFLDPHLIKYHSNTSVRIITMSDSGTSTLHLTKESLNSSNPLGALINENQCSQINNTFCSSVNKWLKRAWSVVCEMMMTMIDSPTTISSKYWQSYNQQHETATFSFGYLLFLHFGHCRNANTIFTLKNSCHLYVYICNLISPKLQISCLKTYTCVQVAITDLKFRTHGGSMSCGFIHPCLQVFQTSFNKLLKFVDYFYSKYHVLHPWVSQNRQSCWKSGGKFVRKNLPRQ